MRAGHRPIAIDDQVISWQSLYLGSVAGAGSIHRRANPGKIPLELIEVQVGSYLGEDDIVRLSDVYGRASRLAS